MRKVMFWSPCIYLFVCVCVCYSHNSKRIKPNRMTFSGMIGYNPGTIWFDFGIDRFKGQGQGHKKVKIFFLSYSAVNLYPIGMQLMPKCGCDEGMRSTECPF